MGGPKMNRIVVIAFVALFCSLSASSGARGVGEGSAFVVATDYPSLQAAVDALPRRGGTVYLPPGNYALDKPLNLTGRTTIPRSEKWPHGGEFVKIIGAGRSATTISGNFDKGPIVDLTFTGYSIMKDLKISGTAEVGILLAREKPGGGSAGGNIFENLTVSGGFKKAAVYDMGSECNRFYNCWFYSREPGGYCFYSTPRNPLGVKSTYVPECGGGCNTELKFYGCCFINSGKGSVGLRIDAYSNDVTLYGGYFSNQGFAAIYLDGTQACLDGINIKDIRIEGQWGEHCVYTKGVTRNIRIEGGAWGSGLEPIYQESAESWDGSEGEAYAWDISSLNLALRVDPERVSGPEFAPRYRKGDEDFYALARFRNLKNSRIDVRHFAVPIYYKDEKGEVKVRYASNVKTVVVEDSSVGNELIAPRRDNIELKGHAESTLIRALSDGGVQRFYMTEMGSRTLINMKPVDPDSIPNPRPGDIAVDMNWRLRIYDGEKWRELGKTP